MSKKFSGIAILLCNCLEVYTMNMMVKPEALQSPTSATPQSPAHVPEAPANGQTQPAIKQPTLPAVVSAIPAPPTPPPAPPTEQKVTIINAAPFLMNVRFETNGNPSVIDSIPGNSSKDITHKINTLIMYSFEQLPSKPITPTMINQGVVTIETPAELVPAPVPSTTAPSAQNTVKSALSDTSPVPSKSAPAPAIVLPNPQLPASASSKGPPGYKAERP